MCRVIAVSNQKGGVGKTVSCVNLGIGLAQEGRKDDLRKEYSTADVTNRHYQGGFPQTVRRECWRKGYQMKIQLIDFGGRSPERAHANDAGADVFSPKDAVIRPGDICKLPLGFGCQS